MSFIDFQFNPDFDIRVQIFNAHGPNKTIVLGKRHFHELLLFLLAFV